MDREMLYHVVKYMHSIQVIVNIDSSVSKRNIQRDARRTELSAPMPARQGGGTYTTPKFSWTQ